MSSQIRITCLSPWNVYRGAIREMACRIYIFYYLRTWHFRLYINTQCIWVVGPIKYDYWLSVRLWFVLSDYYYYSYFCYFIHIISFLFYDLSNYISERCEDKPIMRTNFLPMIKGTRPGPESSVLACENALNNSSPGFSALFAHHWPCGPSLPPCPLPSSSSDSFGLHRIGGGRHDEERRPQQSNVQQNGRRETWRVTSAARLSHNERRKKRPSEQKEHWQWE